MRTDGKRWRLGIALLVAVLAPVALALASGVATVHRCVPVGGSWADLGLRLALVHPDTGCPQGTLALGGQPEQALTIAVGITVPALVGHLAMLAGGLGLVGVVRSVLTALVQRLVPSVPGWPAQLPRTPGALVASAGTLLQRSLHLHQVKLRRGPPLAA